MLVVVGGPKVRVGGSPILDTDVGGRLRKPSQGICIYTHFIKLVLTFFGLYGIRTFLGLPPLFKNFVSKIFLVHVIFEFF